MPQIAAMRFAQRMGPRADWVAQLAYGHDASGRQWDKDTGVAKHQKAKTQVRWCPYKQYGPLGKILGVCVGEQTGRDL